MIHPGTPFTVNVIVFGEMDNAVDKLAQALSSGEVARAVSPALQRLSAAARQSAIREISVVGAGLLDLDLSSLIVAGWRKYATLIHAAQRTAAMPGSEEVVDIAIHQITIASSPHVELLINEVRAATIRLELALDFDITALAAVIRGGYLVALNSGRCKGTGRVAIEGVNVVTRTAELDLHMFVHIGNGIPLIPGVPLEYWVT
jgi:hypothetical protein